jgi:type IV pilus assembly protein PilM
MWRECARMTGALGSMWRALAPGKGYDIGLHIGLERVNLLQLQPGASGPAVRAAASVNHGMSRDELMADPARLREVIKRTLAEQPFRGTRVVTCLPSDQVRMLLLSYTMAEGTAEADAVIRELRERVHEGLEAMVVDYIPVRQEDPSRPKEAIVAMAPREKVTAYLDALSECGLDVACLDVAPAALTRLMSWISGADRTTHPNLLLINFGASRSYLTVVWGRRLMLDRSIEFAEQRLLARLHKILDIPEAEGKRLLLERGFAANGGDDDANELVHTLKEVLRPEFAGLKAEVNNTLVYTASRAHGRSVDTIYVIGSIARYPGIEDLLREQFSLPVKILDPLSVFSHRLSETQLSWLWPRSGVAAATGLALRGVPLQWQTST